MYGYHILFFLFTNQLLALAILKAIFVLISNVLDTWQNKNT